MNAFDHALVGAKRVTYSLVCGGDHARYLNLRGAAVRFAVKHQLYEPRYISFLRRHVRRGDVVIDVGANFGAYTLALADAVGPRGWVYAFEPLADVYQVLSTNTAHLPHVQLLNLALSDHPGDREMSVPLLFGAVPEVSLASLERAVAGATTRRVVVDTLDQVLSNVTRVKFIKVDIEGHELAFLRGAVRTLERCRPLVQFEAADLAAEFQELTRFALATAYEICALNPKGTLRPIDDPAEETEFNYYLRPVEHRAA